RVAMSWWTIARSMVQGTTACTKSAEEPIEACAPERMGQRGEAAFDVGQVQPATAELGFEDTILLESIGDHLLLVRLHPAGNHGDEHVQDHGVSSDWKP